MGKITIRAVQDAHIEAQILRLLRGLGAGSIAISQADIFSEGVYTAEGTAIPDLGECMITVRESRTEGSDWLSITQVYTLEPRR